MTFRAGRGLGVTWLVKQQQLDATDAQVAALIAALKGSARHHSRRSSEVWRCALCLSVGARSLYSKNISCVSVIVILYSILLMSGDISDSHTTSIFCNSSFNVLSIETTRSANPYGNARATMPRNSRVVSTWRAERDPDDYKAVLLA